MLASTVTSPLTFVGNQCGMQARLLRYAVTALRFGDAGVDPALVSFNRTVLLHGPPGTGAYA